MIKRANSAVFFRFSRQPRTTVSLDAHTFDPAVAFFDQYRVHQFVGIDPGTVLCLPFSCASLGQAVRQSLDS